LIKRINHVEIFVRNLDQVMKTWKNALGFEVTYGGRHSVGITHNALVRFGLDYIELLGVVDWDKAMEHPMAVQASVDMVEKKGVLATSFACVTGDLEVLVERIKTKGGFIKDPVSMERTRPDGKILAWSMAFANESFFKRDIVPFFLEWETPDQIRSGWDPPGKHPNTAARFLGISLAVKDLDAGRRIYESHFGMAPVMDGPAPELSAHRARYAAGEHFIELLSPSGRGPVAGVIDDLGQGPFQYHIGVIDLGQAKKMIDKTRVNVTQAPEVTGAILIDDPAAVGVRLVLSEVKTP
jgi:catechol 2,3-dioxygenase-like lactoylglutathione lyase family enzyme